MLPGGLPADAPVLAGISLVRGAAAQVLPGDLADRPVADVVIEGVAGDVRDLVENNVRIAPGDPFDATVVRDDVRTIQRLGRFGRVDAEAELLADGTVRVRYVLEVQPTIREVQTIGNKALSDQELLAVVRQTRGGPRDDYLIEKAARDIKRLYRTKGYYLTEVQVDEGELAARGLLLFRIIEGPRLRVKEIDFRGNASFRPSVLLPEIETRTHIFLLRRGVLDEDQLDRDVAALDRYYRDRGYLDVRVDRGIELSPDNREAKVTFFVAEGPQYVLGDVRVESLLPDAAVEVFSRDQIVGQLDIKPGDVFSDDRLQRSLDELRATYHNLGHADVRVVQDQFRRPGAPVVDLLLLVEEGPTFRTGEIIIQDNFLTKDKVIRAQLTFEPGRPLDRTELEESERRLRNTRLFSDVRITVQEPDPTDPTYRDVLIEVRERNTGSVNFGAAIGSDAGVFGEISIRQDNFDIADFPESMSELFRGRAFRGAGQRFNASIRPGDEVFEYSASLTEPRLLETDWSLTLAGSYRDRRFQEYDEERLRGNVNFGRRFGDVWEGGIRLRFENVELTDIQGSANTETLLDRGPDSLTGVGVTLVRTTVGTINRPDSGSRLELGLERVGLLGGDYDFTRADAEFTMFLALAEDFLGRKSILKLTTRAGYIFDADPRVPTYERFYLGGRSFRGFEFRTIAPKGVRIDNGQPSNDAVGGTWLFFAGAQYEVPLFEQSVNWVVFVDSGTVTQSVGFDEYRVSAGFGFRVYVPQLGPLPIAFDFGFPILSEDLDEEQVLSFSADFPF